MDVRRLAYDIAVKTGVNNPFNETTKMAGKDWLCGFFARHPDLSIKNRKLHQLLALLALGSWLLALGLARINEFFQINRSVLETAQLGKSRQPKERDTLQKLRVGDVALQLQSCVPSMHLPATNVYVSMEEDGGSFDERGTTRICRLLHSEWLN